MSQAMFTAVSGVRANQQRLNVISNNIANVNTIGFKSSSANFATVFAQTITGGTSPTGTLGGTNPMQLGNGVQVSEIPANFSQGGAQFTGRNTDLMINGEGFFVVERIDTNLGTAGSNYYLTRAGNFTLDSSGNLVTPSGDRVRGTSQLSGSGPATLGLVNIPQTFLAVKDLDANNNIVATHIAALGTGAGAIAAAQDPGAVTQSIATVRLVNFSVGTDGGITASYSNGDRITVRTDTSTVSAVTPTAARRQIIHLPAEGGTFAAINQVASDSGVLDQIGTVFIDGTGAANLEGMQMQIQMATVTNPPGLLYDGRNNFTVGANSGTTAFGVPSIESRGSLQMGALESSNVDLAGEFSNMIVSQRGLEAASRVIRTQSEVMQTIINTAG
jgi:flagellar hook protein FlgE